MVNFTPEEMIRYLYNELNSGQKDCIENELENNWAFREKFNVIKESVKRLNNMKLESPRQNTINEIMEYACGSYKVSS